MQIAKLLPRALKSRFLGAFRSFERENRVKVASLIPMVELEARHVAGTKLLTNREHLLEVLPKGGIVAEIGVNQGEFSQSILTLNRPKKLHLIDVWGSARYHSGLYDNVKAKFATQLSEGTVEINKGYSTEVLPTFPDNYFDWVYIDSAHDYQTTADELSILKTKMKKGGFICGHDYVNSCWRNAVKYGVVEAVHEFCAKEDWEMAYLTSETHQHLSFCIRKIE